MNQSRKEENPFISIATMLRMVWEENAKSNSLLEDIRDSITKKKIGSPSAIMPLNIEATQSLAVENRKVSLLTSIDSSLRSIATQVKRLAGANGTENKPIDMSTRTSGTNMMKHSINFLEDKVLGQTELDMVGAGIGNLSIMMGKLIGVVHTIKNLVSNIFAYLPNLATNPSEGKAKHKVMVLGDIAKAIQIITKNITDKSAKAWNSFVTSYIKFINSGNPSKLVAFTSALMSFSFALRIIGLQVSATKNLFWGLLISMTMLSLLLISPIFIMGIGVLIGAVFLFKKVLGDKEDNGVKMLITNSSRVAMSLLKLAGAFWIASKIPFPAVVKFGLMLLLIYGIIALFSRNESASNAMSAAGGVTKVSGLFSLALGLGLLALTVAAFGEVNWSAVGMLVIFMISLGVAMFLGNIGGGQSNLGSQMLMLAIGFGILLLAIDAIKELDWKSVFMLVSFMFILGAALAAVAYFNSKKAAPTASTSSNTSVNVSMSGMWGFAFGIGLLVLALDAVSEVAWTPVLKMVTFIGGIILAMSLGNRISQGGNIGEQFKALALGMTALIGVLALTGDIQVDKVGYLLGYMGITIGVMYLFKQFFKDHEEDKKRGLNIAEALTALVVAYVLIDKINNDTKKVWTFMLISSLFTGVLFLVGKYKRQIEDGIWTMMKALTVFSMSLLLFWGVQKAELDYKEIGKFALAIAGWIGFLNLVAFNSKNVNKGTRVLGSAAIVMMALAGTLIAITLASISIGAFFGFMLMAGFFGAYMMYAGVNQKNLLKGAVVVQSMSLAFGIMLGVTVLIGLFGATFGKMMAFIGILGGMTAGMIFAGKAENHIRKGVKSMALIAGVSLLFVGISYLLGQIDVSEYTYKSFFILTAGLVTLTFLVGSFDSTIKKGAINMGLVAASALAFAGALHWISSIQIDYGNLGTYALMVIGFIGITVLASLMGPMILIGGGAMALVALSAVMFAASMYMIMSLNIDNERLKQFGLTVAGLMLIAAGSALISIPAVIGAAAMAAVAVVSIVTALALFIISLLEYDPQSMVQFGKSVEALAQTYSNNFRTILKATPAALAMGLISLTSIFTALTLKLIGWVKPSVDGVKQFGTALTELVDTYDSFGLITTGKAALKAIALVPIVASAYAAAQLFKLIGQLNIQPAAMDNFNILLDKFITVVTGTMTQSAERLKDLHPALEAFGTMVSSMKGLADVVETFANMKLGVWKYDASTGKMNLVDYKKIDDNMMAQVGVGIGKLIQALLGPLTIISSDSDYWDFGGGVKIKNPFKRDSKLAQFFLGDKESGANRLAQLGNGYSALTAVMANLSNIDILGAGESKRFDTFKTQFGQFIEMLVIQSHVMMRNLPEVNAFKTKLLSLETMRVALERWGSVSMVRVLENHGPLQMLMSRLSDSGVWDKIGKNLKKTGDNMKTIVDNINKINIDKAMALERNLKLMAQTNTLDGIKEVIIHLKQLIGVLEEQERRQEEYNRKQLDAIKQVTEAQEKLTETTAKSAASMFANPMAPMTTATVPLAAPVSRPSSGSSESLEDIRKEKKKLEERLEELVTLMRGRGINVNVMNLDGLGNKI